MALFMWRSLGNERLAAALIMWRSLGNVFRGTGGLAVALFMSLNFSCGIELSSGKFSEVVISCGIELSLGKFSEVVISCGIELSLGKFSEVLIRCGIDDVASPRKILAKIFRYVVQVVWA